MEQRKADLSWLSYLSGQGVFGIHEHPTSGVCGVVMIIGKKILFYIPKLASEIKDLMDELTRFYEAYSVHGRPDGKLLASIQERILRLLGENDILFMERV